MPNPLGLSIPTLFTRRFEILWFLFYFLSPSIALKNEKRSRFGGFVNDNPDGAEIRVGLPSPPIKCSSAIYGKPILNECRMAQRGFWSSRNSFPPSTPNDMAVREFLGSIAPRRDPTRPVVHTPWTSRFQDCVITVTMVRGGLWSDLATLRDVAVSSSEVNESCMGGSSGYTGPPNPNPQGGYHAIGGNNDIGVFVYSSNSDFAKRMDPNLGCLTDEDAELFGALTNSLPKCGSKRVLPQSQDDTSESPSQRSRTFAGMLPQGLDFACMARPKSRDPRTPTACSSNADCCQGYGCSGKSSSTADIIYGASPKLMPYVSWCVDLALATGMRSTISQVELS